MASGPLLYAQVVGDPRPFPKFTIGLRVDAFMDNFSDLRRSEQGSPFELDDNTVLVGLDSYIGYNLLDGLAAGLGIGVAEFNEPRFVNVPVFWTLVLNGGASKDSIHAQAILGQNFTGEKQKGAYYKFYFGYRFKVLQKLKMNVCLAYTFQNLYKSFENSERSTDYYNYESAGLSIGFDIN